MNTQLLHRLESINSKIGLLCLSLIKTIIYTQYLLSIFFLISRQHGLYVHGYSFSFVFWWPDSENILLQFINFLLLPLFITCSLLYYISLQIPPKINCFAYQKQYHGYDLEDYHYLIFLNVIKAWYCFSFYNQNNMQMSEYFNVQNDNPIQEWNYGLGLLSYNNVQPDQIFDHRIQNHQPQDHNSICTHKVSFKLADSQSAKDPNPNLLKNLVAILRRWVFIKEQVHGKLEADVWKYFKEHPKINKNLVWIIYGDVSQDLEGYHKFQQEVPILKCVDHKQYQKIQQKIQRETVVQLIRADMQYILKYRRVQDRERFNSYFYQFVSNVQNGVLFKKKKK